MPIFTPPIFPFGRYITYNLSRRFGFSTLVSKFDRGNSQRREKNPDDGGEPTRAWELKFSPLDGADLVAEFLNFWKQQRGPVQPFWFYDGADKTFYLVRFAELEMRTEEVPVRLFETGILIVQDYTALP